MKIFVIKTLSGLAPASRTDFDKLQETKLKLGQMYQVEITKPRNLEFHKKFFALINICYGNQECFGNSESLRKYLIMKAGYYNHIETPQGAFYEPQSISFASMDELEFNKLYDAVLVQVMQLLDIGRDDILEQLKDF